MGLITGITLGLAAAGTAISAIGQIKAGNEAKRIGEFNAAASEARAVDALARGKEEEDRFRAGVRGLIGSQRSAFAAQGVVVSEGSAVDVQADTAYLGELDSLTVRNNAAREAWGYRVEAEEYRRGGEQAKRASRFGAASSILSTGSSLLVARYGFGGKGAR
jgi:hypothetical protein